MQGAVAVAVTDLSSAPSVSGNAATSRTIAKEFGVERMLELVPMPMADVSLRASTEPEVQPRDRYESLCRIVNCSISLVALVLLSPVILLIALAVKLTSEGPVFYSQVRVGVDRRTDREITDDRRVFDLGGRPFRMLKFRTMHVDAEADGRAVWAAKRDPRVTSVGRLLRRTRLDELPQLFNVLRGEMNIVGPRPERPTLFADLSSNIPHYRLRQRVKPGITGWAQINQPYDSCVDDVRRKVQYDLEYLQRQGMLEDLRIMTLTLPVMLFGQKGW